MFGNFENNNHDTQEVINNLSMAELVTQTKNELANLKKNITQSKLFDNQEKHGILMDVESGITEADLSKEKSGLSVEKETTDALATLLANIRNTIPKHGNSDQQRNTFDKVRRFGSGESYAAHKNKKQDKYDNLLLLTSINNHLENSGTFVVGGVMGEAIATYNNNEEVVMDAINAIESSQHIGSPGANHESTIYIENSKKTAEKTPDSSRNSNPYYGYYS